MTPNSLASVIAGGESLTVEFKRDMDDAELVAAVVCLANGDGGLLLIGIDDDGTVKGARPRHGAGTDPARVAALVANTTSPAVAVAVERHEVEGQGVIVIDVPRAAGLVSTAGGHYLRRAIDVHGRPQCLPMQPHDALARLTRVGQQDASVLPAVGASLDDLDADELQRFRALSSAGGDQVLGELSDHDLVSALGFVTAHGEFTLGSILLFGTPDAISRFAPTHETAFQVIEHLEVRAQRTGRDPLIKAMVDLIAAIEPYNPEEELQSGLFRVGLPRFAGVALRELVANALVHRDYSSRGQILVSIEDGTLSIANPGGFPEGVNIANLLVAPPQARNPRIADAFKRAGLVERTGRGVNRVFLGQLELGRTQPDYGRSTQQWVEVRLRAGPADKEMAAFVAQARRDGQPLHLSVLQVLHEVRQERRITSARAGELLQVGTSEARATLNDLVERGFLEARGEGKGRTYHLSGPMYRTLGGPAGYIRTRGFDGLQQQQMVLAFVREHGTITRSQAAELCQLSPDQATRLLGRLRDQGHLVMVGRRRTARYVAARPAKLDDGGETT